MAPSASFIEVEPPTVIGPATKKATRPSSELPQSLIQAAKVAKREAFDPSKHLNFQPPKTIHTMEQIGLKGHGISPHAATEPFPLFTQEAIAQMRAEIFDEKVLAECQYSSTFNKHTIRGMGPASPEVIARISGVAGIDLVPSIDFEIAIINISVGNENINPDAEQTETINHASEEGEKEFPAVAWHYDSFPFICVTMLSDCTGMVGGETALRTPDGEIMKHLTSSALPGHRRRPQGRYIEHQALKALGGHERISMATCFRPRSPLIRDETVLVGVRGISDLDELYSQSFDVKGTRRFLRKQVRFLESIIEEILEVE
ncbi:hypothetical protein BDV10DRAFT_202991 [Aspergillus recurvatus]